MRLPKEPRRLSSVLAPSAEPTASSPHARSDRRRALVTAFAVGALLFGVGLAACIGMWRDVDATIRADMRRHLKSLASAAAAALDPELHERVRRTGTLDDADYQRAVAPLQALVARVPELTYAYTLELDGTTPRFVLDAAAPGDHDGDGVEDRARLHEPYEDADPWMLRALGADGSPPAPQATSEPTRDKWGEFVTGYAPILDADGRRVGVVGVDVRADAFVSQLAAARRSAWLGALPAFVVAILVAWGAYALRRRMLETARRVVENEALFRTTIDACPAMVWVSDTSGAWVWHNRFWDEFTGGEACVEYGAGQVDDGPRNVGWRARVHPDDVERVSALVDDAHAEQTSFRLALRLRWHDGTYRRVEMRGMPFHGEDGEFRGHVGMVFDVTEQLAAEESLADSARRNADLAAAIDVVRDALCLTDRDARITYVNREFERQTGWRSAEVVGRRTSILRSGETDPSVYRELWSTITQGRTWKGRLKNRRRDEHDAAAIARAGARRRASTYWVESTITPLLDGDGRITGFVSVQRDVTETVQREAHARLVAVGAEARAAVASILSGGSPVSERVELALRRLLTVCASGPYAQGAVLVPTDGDEGYRVLAAIGTGAIGAAGPEFESLCPPALRAACDRAARSHRADVVATCTDHVGTAHAHGHFVLPLVHADELEGLLILPAAASAADASERLAALMPVAEIVAVALVKARAEDLLLEAMRKADAASRAKSEFLANMSHEIRTPLTAILGYADVLAEDEELARDTVRRNASLDTIRAAGQHLLSVVNDILDVSKIEAGRMTIEAVDVELPTFLRDTLAIFEPRAAERGLRLGLVVENALPERVRTDPTRVRQVVMNLVGNALKFTERGGVVVRVRAAVVRDEAELAVSVEDTGPGLEPDEQARLFQAFSQGDPSVTRRHGGTGLGLVISQRLARLMGGNVVLTRTEPGVGTTFTATFRMQVLTPPVSLDAVPAALPSPSRETRATPRGDARLFGRFLLAEDGRDNQRLISLQLQRAGATVDVAENGRIALERFDAARAKGEPYDFLVTDVQMPELDGISLTRALRARGVTIPIVALTAHAMTEDRARCLAAGCDGFATKPLDRSEFLPLCAELLARSKMTPA